MLAEILLRRDQDGSPIQHNTSIAAVPVNAHTLSFKSDFISQYARGWLRHGLVSKSCNHMHGFIPKLHQVSSWSDSETTQKTNEKLD